MLDFRDSIMDALKTPITTYKIAQFPENRLFHFGVEIQDGGSSPSWILGVP